MVVMVDEAAALVAAFVVAGLTVERVVLSRVTETTPFVGSSVDTDDDDDDEEDVDTDEEFRCAGVPRGVVSSMAVDAAAGDVVVETVDVDVDEELATGAIVVGLAVVRRVVELGGGAVALFLGNSESTTPTGPLRSISVSGQVISAGSIE